VIGNAISEDLTNFIHANIDSVEMLEILGFLCQNDGRAWSPSEVADHLYLQVASAQVRLAGLQLKGLCRHIDSHGLNFQYDAADLEQDRLVRELIHAYRVRRASIISLIFQPAT
jgi:hypothetical protein